jgi:glucose/arabinose dehydrogenase
MRAAAARTCALAFAALAMVGCAQAKLTDAAEPRAVEKPPAMERAPRRVRVPPAAETPKSVPVAATPEGLLAPGAEQKIHDKLSAGGFLKEATHDSTGAALRRFQAAHDLPATGVPDHETVRRLGLKPDDLFRKAAP